MVKQMFTVQKITDPETGYELPEIEVPRAITNHRYNLRSCPTESNKRYTMTQARQQSTHKKTKIACACPYR